MGTLSSLPGVVGMQQAFRDFTARLSPGSSVVVLCHSDADGLPAGAILARALRRVGHTALTEVTGKGEHPWSDAVRVRLAAHEPQALLVADLGSRPEPLLPGVPTLLIDHHRPTGTPPDAVLLTGYGWDPTPTAGLLAYWCAQAIAEADDLCWLAAISLLSDLGDDAPFELLAQARQRYRITPLREATALLNAPRRSASGDARPALDLLLVAEEPQEVVRGTRPEVAILKAARQEVSAAMNEAKKAAPRFVGDVALVRCHTPCQVHPLLAQIWRTRLPKHLVLSANTGYLPGRVNFSMRTATGRNLLDFLREHRPAQSDDAYGHGHDQASGGSLVFAAWNEFVAKLGFGAEAAVE